MLGYLEAIGALAEDAEHLMVRGVGVQHMHGQPNS